MWVVPMKVAYFDRMMAEVDTPIPCVPPPRLVAQVPGWHLPMAICASSARVGVVLQDCCFADCRVGTRTTVGRLAQPLRPHLARYSPPMVPVRAAPFTQCSFIARCSELHAS